MKILTKEEEQEHYNATLTGGIGGGLAGLALGALGVWGATKRFPAFNSLTLPLKAFLVTSSGTFAAIVSADKYSRDFESNRSPDHKYKDEAAKQREEAEARRSRFEKAKDWGKENRYPIVFGSWIASMGIALGLVGRNPYLSTSQKIVQARVYAQGLTLAVLVATAAFEIGDKNNDQGRWETVKVVDPNDPTHKHLIDKKVHHERYAGEDQWRDMIEAEERREKERKAAIHEREERHHKEHKAKHQDQKKLESHESDSKGEKGKSKEGRKTNEK
ncbi:MAG: hypothetical protein M1836_002650 [Candelina mexicana]|nr:MAG: hypothetical protein M1836_002650 [Candelina mexicana]